MALRPDPIPYFNNTGPLMPPGWQLDLLVKAINEADNVVNGQATVDFGAFVADTASNGALQPEASVTVTGCPTILSTSQLQCSIALVDTADHYADEARIENIRVRAGTITPGIGFVIYAECTLGGALGKYAVNWSYQ